VKELNTALLAADYSVEHWDLPEGALCPPVPGRADYIHYLADILSDSANGGPLPSGGGSAPFCNPPSGHRIRGLDIGTGSNLIYPLLGNSVYGWSFIGSEIDTASLASAQTLINRNGLEDRISLRHQPCRDTILQTILSESDSSDEVDFIMCNPPFYESEEAFQKENSRKLRNLANSRQKNGANNNNNSNNNQSSKTGSNNFGGNGNELWYPGGEVNFIRTMIKESSKYKHQCLWFTSLVSRKEHIPMIEDMLYDNNHLKLTKVVEMGQGQKTVSIVVWSFMDWEEHLQWSTRRGWGGDSERIP